MTDAESSEGVQRGHLECHLCDLETVEDKRRHGVEVTRPAGQPDEQAHTVWVCPTCADIHTVEEVRSNIPVKFEEDK